MSQFEEEAREIIFAHSQPERNALEEAGWFMKLMGPDDAAAALTRAANAHAIAKLEELLNRASYVVDDSESRWVSSSRINAMIAELEASNE